MIAVEARAGSLPAGAAAARPGGDAGADPLVGDASPQPSARTNDATGRLGMTNPVAEAQRVASRDER